MNSHLGWVAERKGRYMKIQKVLSQTLLISALALFSAFAVAQDQPPDQDQNQNQPDPPTRVGRVNMVQGSVSFQPGGEGDWVAAVPNRPLTTGDNLWADQNSRAEMHIGSTAIRLDSETSLTILDLDDHTTQLKVSQGSVILRVRHVDDGDTHEVDTPNLAFDIQRTGEYRIDVNSDGTQTDVSVLSGRGEVTGGGYSYDVVGGQDARFTGTDQLNYDIQQLPDHDDFTKWAMDRDHREDGPESADYVSPEMTGYEDLDDYGHWTNVAGYGNVWQPSNVAADWAPYRNGHWVFIEPWGWTWVEDEPWGFAPFHYGRWAYAGSRWCWIPGPVVVRAVYAPALVAFVGGGGGGFHFSIGVGGGGIGWFPLGPGEVYVPSYRVSRVYVNNINVTNTRVNVTQITNVYNVYNNHQTTNITYVNQRVNNSVTVVTHDTFVNARPVQRNIVRVDEREIASAPAWHRPEMQPVRQSVIGGGAPVNMHPPNAIINRQVVATRNPPAPRAPFEQRQPINNVRTEQPANQPRPLDNNRLDNNHEVVRNPGQPGTMSPTMPQQRQPQQQQPQQQPPQTSTREPMRNIPRPPSPGQQGQQPPDRGQQPPDRVQQPENNNNQQVQMHAPRQVENPTPQQTHPLVRQAPPVQEKSQQQQQKEEQQYRNWDQQRRSAPARNESKPEHQDSHGDKHPPKSNR